MGRCDAVTHVGHAPCGAARWRELAGHRSDAVQCESQIDHGRRVCDHDEHMQPLGLKLKPRAAVATRSPSSDEALQSVLRTFCYERDAKMCNFLAARCGWAGAV